jgi:type IV secretory pathway protease TraF
MVKRVARRAGSEIFVAGDNESASTDSRHFGPVRPSAVVGRVVYRYHPEARRGWLGTRR